MKIALGSDHGGYALKCDIIQLLEKLGHEYKDFGCYSTESCDYPDFGEAAARAVASGEYDRGIVICTTGIGISIAANKVAGIRCAHCTDPLSAEMTRRHNDANVLCFGARVVGSELAKMIVDEWINAEFEGGRTIELVLSLWQENLFWLSFFVLLFFCLKINIHFASVFSEIITGGSRK